MRWSDGTRGEALRWYDDEVLFCEGDLLGKTDAELRTLHFAAIGSTCATSRAEAEHRPSASSAEAVSDWSLRGCPILDALATFRQRLDAWRRSGSSNRWPIWEVMRKLIPLVLTVLVVGAGVHSNSGAVPAGQGTSAVAAGSSCHANYTGACLRPDSPDYDCADGNGDGPDFTGPVQVVGDDPYGLDGDGDGAACGDEPARGERLRRSPGSATARSCPHRARTSGECRASTRNRASASSNSSRGSHLR